MSPSSTYSAINRCTKTVQKTLSSVYRLHVGALTYSRIKFKPTLLKVRASKFTAPFSFCLHSLLASQSSMFRGMCYPHNSVLYKCVGKIKSATTLLPGSIFLRLQNNHDVAQMNDMDQQWTLMLVCHWTVLPLKNCLRGPCNLWPIFIRFWPFPSSWKRKTLKILQRPEPWKASFFPAITKGFLLQKQLIIREI